MDTYVGHSYGITSPSIVDRLCSGGSEGEQHNLPHDAMQSISIPLVPVDIPVCKEIPVKLKMDQQDDSSMSEQARITTDLSKSHESDWVTDMSGCNSSLFLQYVNMV